jgi:hypothetical protein
MIEIFQINRPIDARSVMVDGSESTRRARVSFWRRPGGVLRKRSAAVDEPRH